MPLAKPERAASRVVAPLLILSAVVLVPWTLYLSFHLPARHTSHAWDVAWIGFDAALALMLALTGIAIVRRPASAPIFATVAATLLCCDAWFDNVLASTRHERMEAALGAGLIELPLGLLCVWLARHPERTMEVIHDAAQNRPRNRKGPRGEDGPGQ